MAATLEAEYAFDAEDLGSSTKIVKFAVIQRHEEEGATQEHELASFEAMMLPCMDAAHNLARWLLRNEQDAQDVVQEAYLRAFRSFAGFRGSNGRAWLLTIVRNTAYTLLKKNRAADLTTTFDEEIHAADPESVSPATILEHAEDAELIRKAMDGITRRVPGDLGAASPGRSILQGDRRHREDSDRYSDVAARPRTCQT